jgi:hypothetical protein
MAFGVHSGHSADESSQTRTDQAQDHRQHRVHMPTAGHEGSGNQTCNQSEDGEAKHVLTILSLSYSWRSRDQSSTLVIAASASTEWAADNPYYR